MYRLLYYLILVILLSSFTLVEQDNEYHFFKTEVIEHYNLYHLNRSKDSILIVSKRKLSEFELINTNLKGCNKIDRIYIEKDSVFFTYTLTDVNNQYDIKQAYFKPGTSYKEYYSYKCLPYYID